MPKHKLADEAAAPDVTVIGISCHVPDYRLCWSLNKALGLELERRREDIVERARGKDLHYPVFQQNGPEGIIAWALVCNTCGKRRLLPDQKEADLFLVVDQETAEREERYTVMQPVTETDEQERRYSDKQPVTRYETRYVEQGCGDDQG